MNINRDILKKVYTTAFKIRSVEEMIAQKYKEQEMRCPTHLSIGQELVPAIYTQFITNDDYAVSTHRAHAHYIAKGGDINKMIAEIYGKETGCSKGLGGSMHLIDESVGFMGSTAIVGGTIPIGIGLGLSIKIKKEERISTVFLGDGATEEGVFYESLNFAALKELPVLFICENNMYSVYSNLSVRQPEKRKIFELSQAIGVKASYANGYDIEESFLKIKDAVEYVRNEKKPFFIELDTYRFREHCGPNFDNDIGYRDIAEYEKFFNEDPLIKLENLFIDDLTTASEIEQIKTDVVSAFEFAQKSSFPKYENIQRYLYQ